MRTVEELKDKSYEARIKYLEKEIMKAMGDNEFSIAVLEEELAGLEEDVIGAGFNVENGVISWS